jgi:integral membrane protein (TIGR01906 family)
MKTRTIIAFILIPILIFLFSTITVVYDKEFYTNELANLGSSENLVAGHEKIAGYLTDGGNAASLDSVAGMTAAEKSHLADVKDLMKDLPILFLVLALVWLTLFNRIKEKRKILLYGGLVAVAIPLLLAIVPFDSIFTLFHQLFFPQGNWMFSPDSLLIQIYPIQFFHDAAFRIFAQGFVAGAFFAAFAALAEKLQ